VFNEVFTVMTSDGYAGSSGHECSGRIASFTTTGAVISFQWIGDSASFVANPVRWLAKGV
jgi:hypothetical protein